MIFFIVLAYVVGALPTGYWISRSFFGLDITQHGSGNIGASNVARVLGKRYFFVVFFIDAFKAYAILMIGNYYNVYSCYHGAVYAVVAALLLGNAYSCFLNFKGGKGVATIAGIYLYFLSVPFMIIFFVSWMIVLVATRKPFLASMLAVGLVTCMYGFVVYDQKSLFFVSLFAWVVFRHSANLGHWYKIGWRRLFSSKHQNV